MFQSIGGAEWFVIAIIIILLFGGKKIPELFKTLSGAIKEFKKSIKDSE